MSCTFCGAAVLTSGSCLNAECITRRPTPAASFEAAKARTPEERVIELEGALRKYGRHTIGCAGANDICLCGLSVFIK